MNNIALRLILCDLRSTANVGSLLRTGDACGVELVYACGYTPYPTVADDERPPHVSGSNTKSIAKTALGAELTVPILHKSNPSDAIAEAKRDDFTIIVIEQAETSLNLLRFNTPSNAKIALVLGNEVTGVDAEIMALADRILEIPMVGSKESLGVAVAGAIALYQVRFGSV